MRIVLLAAALLFAAPAMAAPVQVTVKDKGVVTTCAEEDNVYAVLEAPGVRRFEAVARHPVYGKDLKTDNYKADFSGCKPATFSGVADTKFTPRHATLYEDASVRIDGITYGGYWRPDIVKVEVAGKKDQGFHLIQLFIKHGADVQEALVLHAADGYWRLRPLPLPQFGGAVYGSSFLVGPVEESTRPYVRIAEVKIDPKAMAFHLTYRLGGTADLKVTRIDHEELRMAVSLTPPVAGRPFIALRSMYVAPDNGDTAQLHADDKTFPAVGFGAQTASKVTFGRSIPSRHNTSAPDISFETFEN
jgi:hypothetical protein